MKDKIINHANELVDETVSNIQRLVRINSVRDVEHQEPGKPFGLGIDQAFDEFLAMCQELGMRTFKDPDGKYAYAELGPEDGKLIGILGHLDVVPVGDEAMWTEAKPFSGDVKDNILYGRGSLDDKGPVVINMMAIKNLLDLGYEFKSRIRVIVGGAEETTWECIDKYKQEQEIPVISFSPDSQFPLINAEKTLYQFDAKAKGSYDFSVEAPGAYNAVCDKATYTGSKIEEIAANLDKLGYSYEKTNDSIIVSGQSAHSKDCFEGKNAILGLCMALYEAGIHSHAIDYLATVIKDDCFATNIMGEKLEEDVSGVLTLNVGRLMIKDGEESIGFDSRIPVLLDDQEIKNKYKASVEDSGMEFVQVDNMDKLYVPADSPLVSTLLDIYKEVTGDTNAKPLSSGGATYSRAWDNCVAFGCVFSEQNMIERMHQPNECFEIKFIAPAVEIYSLALYRLDQLN